MHTASVLAVRTIFLSTTNLPLNYKDLDHLMDGANSADIAVLCDRSGRRTMTGETLPSR